MITAQAYEREGFFVANVLLCSHGKASFNFLASVANECFQSYSGHLQPGEARATEQRTTDSEACTTGFVQFWRLEVQDRAVSSAGFFCGLSLGLYTPSPSVFTLSSPPCVSASTFALHVSTPVT